MKVSAYRNLVFSLSLTMSVTAWAEGGANVGNGGDGVVCTAADGTKTVELLDYYEARTLRDIEPKFGDPSRSVDVIVQDLLARLNPLSPGLAATYWKQAKDFVREAAFVSKARLIDIPDSHHLVIPENCSVTQIVIQQTPRFKEDKRYVIDKDLWDLMDNVTKAGMIIHEVIYRYAIAEGHKDSVRTRYFNSIIAGDRLTTITTTRDWDSFIGRDLGFSLFEANSTWFHSKRFINARTVKIWRNTFHSNGKLESATLTGSTSFPVRGQKNFSRVHLAADQVATFDENGHFDFDRFQKAVDARGKDNSTNYSIEHLGSLKDDSGWQCPFLIRLLELYPTSITNCTLDLAIQIDKKSILHIPVTVFGKWKDDHHMTAFYSGCEGHQCDGLSPRVVIEHKWKESIFGGGHNIYTAYYYPKDSNQKIKGQVRSRWATKLIDDIY